MKKLLGLIIVLSMVMTLFVPCMAAEEKAETLADGVYLATFDTDSSMFHVNEACEGKGFLFVKDGEMTIHFTLAAKGIVNLYLGLADEAKDLEEEEWILHTKDAVTYSDGYEEKVYGFTVPVPVLDEEFDLALIGKKGKWYDHKVSVSDPQPVEIEGLDLEADTIEISYEFEGGGKVSFEIETEE